MKHVQVHHKFDWFYEFRPFFILLFGILGLLNRNLVTDLSWLRVSQVCGLILIYFAIKISYWRFEYRRQRVDH